MINQPEEPIALETRQRKPRKEPVNPGIITVFYEEGGNEDFEVEDEKKAAILFDDILEIRTINKTVYVPIDNNVRKWEFVPNDKSKQ